MNCSNCGSPTEIKQQYCRSCGAQLASANPSLANNWAIFALIAAFLGIVVALFGKMVFHEEMIILVGVLISVAGMFSIAATPFVRRSFPKRPTSSPIVPLPVFIQTTTNKLLPDSREDLIPSVVENTTNLLHDPVSLGRSDANH